MDEREIGRPPLRLRDLLAAARRAYYGGERIRGDVFDAMGFVGVALALVRAGAGPDENRPDVDGARRMVEAYRARLDRIGAALERLGREGAGAAPDDEGEGDEG